MIIVMMSWMMNLLKLQTLQSHPTRSPLPQTLKLHSFLGLNGPFHHRQRRVQIHNTHHTFLTVTYTPRATTTTPISICTVRRRRHPPPAVTGDGAGAGDGGICVRSEVFARKELLELGVLDNMNIMVVGFSVVVVRGVLNKSVE